MADPDPFSMSKMLNALQQTRFAAARKTKTMENPAIPPPPPGRETGISEETQSLIHLFRFGFCTASTPKELETCLQRVFNLMTNSSQGSSAQFKYVISNLDRTALQRMASFLTSDSNYFMDIARNKYGSKHLQILLGKSDDVDAFFSAAIMPHFLQIMTHKFASYVAVRALRVFDPEMKQDMYELTLYYALYLASDQHGCIALNEILTDADDPYFRNQLLDIVADYALWLSNDAYGNFVIQHVLKLKDSRCTRTIAFGLLGHCVELSFRKQGSYIVERLLETEVSLIAVVLELLECKGDRLVRLARSEFGNFVVGKALRVTQQIRVDLFCGLVQKLMPFLHLLRRSRGSNIAAILDSIY